MADNSPAKTDSADDEDKDSGTFNAFISKPVNNCVVKYDTDSKNKQGQHLNSSDTKTEIASRSMPETSSVDGGGSNLNSQASSASNGLLSIDSETEMGCSHSQGCMVSGHDSSKPNIAQSRPMKKVCSTHSRPGAGHPNGLVSVCTHTWSALTSQRNSLSSSQGMLSGAQLVHVNGNGAVFHDLSADDNFDQVMSNPQVFLGPSEQCPKGAKPKKLKRRPRRDDRHAKTGVFSKVPSDSDDDDYNFQNSVSKPMPDVGYSLSATELRIREQCNGDVPHSRVPELPPHLSRSLHLNDRSESHDAAALLASPQRDEDLVDEGAVCDFDRNVLAGESLFYTEDASVSSSCDGANLESGFPNGHVLYSMDHPMDSYPRRERKRRSSLNGCYSASDSEDDVFGRAPAAAGLGVQVNVNNVEDVEDNGDFIDTDLPVMSGPLMSSSADSASLSSVNGDMADAGPLPVPCAREQSSSKQENDLSGGSDKELNHKRNSSPDLRRLSDSAMFRTSYSSPSHDGGFDNFLLPRDLSSSDGVFWNSSESENEDEISEGLPQELPANSSDIPGPVHEGAGVAEALVTAPHSDEHAGDPQFGAGGDLVCFYFDRACCLQENQWPTSSCLPHAGQSASRHSVDLPLDLSSKGEAGGACAPPPPVNNLSRLLPATPGLRGPGESMANGLDRSNFINDDSNRQQKVFDKFPMMEEGREGAGTSSSGQGKCDNDNVLFLCPVAPAQGILLDRQGDRASLQDQGALEPNVESCGTMGLTDYNYKTSFGDSQRWRANSESGVSEPVVFEDRTYGYRLYPSSDCCLSENSLHHTLPHSKSGKDSKKKRILCRPSENGVDCSTSVERMMIWSEYEAYLLQVKQIGMSACGQTAVLNLLKAFEIAVEKEDVCSTIQVNLRKEKASIAEYLASRAVAGTTAEELLSGVERLTKGEIRGRFFHLWPPRNVNLLSWLSQWMKRGAVPIATLNLQKGVKQQQIPDAWHHQTVYGVGPRGVYLTNPLEIVSEEKMMEQLTSDSVLLVRRQDVVSRFQPMASLAPLLHHPDPRWCRMNVLGQVVNVLREHNMPSVPGYRAQVTSHIRIPAVYRAGITLYVRHNTAQWTALCSAPDLPPLTTPPQPDPAQ